MLVQLDSKNKIFRGKINKKSVKSMVNTYRNKTAPDKLFYAHFGLEEVIQLFVDNGVLNSGALSHIIPGHGLKIYIGTHDSLDNCPTNRPDYMTRDTAILCTTVIIDEKNFCYSDKLRNGKDSVSLSTNSDPLGSAIDQSSTYPPDNPYDAIPPVHVPVGEDPDNYDIGH